MLGAHSPLWSVGPTADGARRLIEFWEKVDPATGEVRHDFADVQLDTRFLGDLYQDLSDTAKKQYALLQTPIFVEEFILDRTLDPAIAELAEWVRDGSLQVTEHVLDGLEQYPHALQFMFEGGNTGKLLVKVS